MSDSDYEINSDLNISTDGETDSDSVSIIYKPYL